MAVVWIPAQLRPLAGGAGAVTVPGATLRDVIDALDARHPGLRDRLVEDGQIRPGLAVVIDDGATADDLDARLEPDSEVHIVPAISGGAPLGR